MEERDRERRFLKNYLTLNSTNQKPNHLARNTKPCSNHRIRKVPKPELRGTTQTSTNETARTTNRSPYARPTSPRPRNQIRCNGRIRTERNQYSSRKMAGSLLGFCKRLDCPCWPQSRRACESRPTCDR